MCENKKAFIIVPPAYGHINPISSLVFELVKNGMNVIFYGNADNRETIERTGATFRLYSHPNIALIQKHITDPDIENFFFLGTKWQIDFSYELLPSLIDDVERDKPDLIIYDQMFMSAKYLMEILRKRTSKKQTSLKMPKTVQFHPSFAMNKKMFESYPELNMIKPSARMYYYMFALLLEQLAFDFHYGVRIIHPMKLFFDYRDELNIVAVFPEFQPKKEFFDDSYKFVGSCIVEQVRNYQITDENLKSILDTFKPLEPTVDSVLPYNRHKLIYVSLGTFFNESFYIFFKIFKAFKIFDERNKSGLKLDQFKVVISVGESTFDKLKKKLASLDYELPEQVMLFPKVPQIEILKRASLFVTHAGQNSASETIQYAVPVVCIPIGGDQPLVATRMCKELKLGVQLDPKIFKPSELVEALEKVLTDQTFRQNVIELCNTSKKYQGVSTAYKLVLDHLNKDTSDKNGPRFGHNSVAPQ